MDDTAKQVLVLQTEFKSFRREHDIIEEVRTNRVEAIFKELSKHGTCMAEIKKLIYKLPCAVHVEKMKAIEGKIGVHKWLIGLVLSAVVGGFIWMIRS